MIEYTTLGNLIAPARVMRCGKDSFPVLSMTMHDGIVLQSERFKKSLASIDQSDYKVVKRGQLVVGFPIDEGVLYVQKVADEGIMSPAYNVWDIDTEKVDPDFLELCLHSPQSMQYYRNKLRGTTARRRSIPTADLLALSIRLPDMQTQREAVAIMRKTENIIASRQEQLNAFEQLVKSRFIELFNGYDETTKLSEVAVVTGGLTKNSKRDQLPMRMPYLRVANVAFASIDVTEILDIGLTQDEYEKTLLEYEDMLFVEGNGSPDQIGRVAIWRNEITPCVHQNHLIKARFNQSKVKPVFAMHYFMSQSGREQIKSKAVSTSGLFTLSVSKVADLLMPVPPMDIQEHFVAFVEQTDKSKLCGEMEVAA